MNSRRFVITCALIAVGVIAAVSYGINSQAATANPSLTPFEFDREGATNPEDAATSLFRGCAKESPKHFVRHLLLGVCDGPIDTLQKFAESLHRTKFRHGEASFTVYDLPKGINTNVGQKGSGLFLLSDPFCNSLVHFPCWRGQIGLAWGQGLGYSIGNLPIGMDADALLLLSQTRTRLSQRQPLPASRWGGAWDLGVHRQYQWRHHRWAS